MAKEGMQETILLFFEDVERLLRELLREGTSVLKPTIFCSVCRVDSCEEIGMAIHSFSFGESPSERREEMRRSGRLMVEGGALPMVMVLVSEAWTSQDADQAPSESPDRQEVVILGGATITAQFRTVIFETVRDSSGNISIGPEPVWEHNSWQPGEESYEDYLSIAFYQGVVEALQQVNQDPDPP